ncbi:DUF6624 domain-containing protein [Chitinophaga nivalis]|uniref:Tetratricopeptide repeat protein n=1 Tax=Chitinophaga nivalis TaxID=2991709 RepID=A0ABT3IMP9_9BACT|nr:DUF6624 domain-containing protein [Chitinophaga nivalis]MCW3465057.1 hypothetical protein [Chitinophaga nivalis]MCW3485251.1 hypothetical protein [Chitinophaga nivalis]
MKKILSLLLCCALLPHFSIAQQDLTQYNFFVHQADSLYHAGAYKPAALAFSQAFITTNGKGLMNDRYNAACAWALAGVPDSAFFQLEKIVTKVAFADYQQLTNDKDLVSLHTDKRWQPLLDAVLVNKEKEEALLDKSLVRVLDTIYQDDQESRLLIESTAKKYGETSKEMERLWKKIDWQDSINVRKTTAILDQYGWPGPSVIGIRGSTTLFLVIQHAPLRIQQQYLPMMRDAVKKQQASPADLALLEDRVSLGEGRKQIYGSQISLNKKTGKYFVCPLEDPDHVDERREEAGLAPLAEYVRIWGITWDVSSYKKELPALPPCGQ